MIKYTIDVVTHRLQRFDKLPTANIYIYLFILFYFNFIFIYVVNLLTGHKMKIYSVWEVLYFCG